MNNADYGLTLQKMICDKYNLEINDWAQAQFSSSYNKEYEEELTPVVTKIFDEVKSKPTHLLTYSQEFTKNGITTSPHNFELANGKTLSIRTMKTSDKVAPKTVGQAGYSVLNEFFADIYGNKIENQVDIQKLVFFHIHEILPIFIDNMFQSDYTALISRKDLSKIVVINSEEIANYSFSRDEFSFTRGINEWKESTTLKFHGKSIAEIQVHKERSFKFRFIISAIPEWFKIVKSNTESLGISAEGAICEYFDLEEPESFKNRIIKSYVNKVMPSIKKAFETVPPAIKHTGSMKGDRGENSKCSYDFILRDNLTLSLKTNKGKMVCPPEVGQPGAKTCLLYFKEFFEPGIVEVTGEKFKEMVFRNIDKIMPIYVAHLFDSDWLLWVYQNSYATFTQMTISKESIKEFCWKKEKFSFTRPTLEEWNESNTVKYDGLSIGEFQVHSNRNCYKFRFNLSNLLKLLLGP